MVAGILFHCFFITISRNNLEKLLEVAIVISYRVLCFSVEVVRAH